MASPKCICEMCTCGNHACIHNPNPLAVDNEFHGLSEYDSKYVPFDGAKTTSFKPAAFNSSDEPFHGVSTHGADYRPWQVSKTDSFKPSQSFSSAQPFVGSTTVNDDYTAKQADPSRIYRPTVSVFQNSLPLDGTTTHGADYTPKDLQRSLPFVPKSDRNVGQFQDETEHTAMYTEKEGARSRAFKPSSRLLAAGEFDGATTYGGDFVPKRSQRCLAEMVVTGRDKSFVLVGDKGSHIWYKRIK